MGKIRFTIGAGFLVRGQLRNRLSSLKQKVLFEESQANIRIDEVGGLLGSDFYVVITNISDEMAQRLLNWYNKSKKEEN